MSGLRLYPFPTSVRVIYIDPVVKAYWNDFLTPLHTKSTRKCQEKWLKLKILFAYASGTQTCRVCTQNEREECCSTSSTITLTSSWSWSIIAKLHDMTTFCVYQWPEISSFTRVENSLKSLRIINAVEERKWFPVDSIYVSKSIIFTEWLKVLPMQF